MKYYIRSVMMDELEKLVALGWCYQIRAEIGKPCQVAIWRPEWLSDSPYTTRACPTFIGNDIEEVVSMAYAHIRNQPAEREKEVHD